MASVSDWRELKGNILWCMSFCCPGLVAYLTRNADENPPSYDEVTNSNLYPHICPVDYEVGEDALTYFESERPPPNYNQAAIFSMGLNSNRYYVITY